MDQFVEGKNPYTILGLENGQQSSIDEIKKAYRRLALIKHPDKAKTPNAAQEFDELKKAYAILSDKPARAAIDDYLDAQKAREERLSKQDAKRQRMREELERKEKASTRTKNDEELARAKLKEELEALRSRAQQEQQQRQQTANAAAAARAASNAQAGASGRQADAAVADAEDETTQLLMRTVKVTWDPTIGNYTTDRLREIFSAHCSVEDVILKDSRKKKKASALVVLSSTAEAEHAEQQVHGDLNNPLLVTPYLKVMPGVPQQQQQQQQPHGTFTTAAAAGSGSGRSTAPLAAAAGQPSAAGQQPLFATGLAGATSRPVQRPGKPLFPGAAPRQRDAASEAVAAEAQAAPSSFGSFPGMPAQQPAVAAAAAAGSDSSSKFSSFPSMPGEGGGSKFSSFPSFPASASAGKKPGANGVAVAGRYEDEVLGKLHQKGAASNVRKP